MIIKLFIIDENVTFFVSGEMHFRRLLRLLLAGPAMRLRQRPVCAGSDGHLRRRICRSVGRNLGNDRSDVDLRRQQRLQRLQAHAGKLSWLVLEDLLGSHLSDLSGRHLPGFGHQLGGAQVRWGGPLS